MPHPGEQYGSCPRCGARTERFQEYCLDCGERLPRVRPARHAAGLSLGDRLGPAAALLGLTIVATAASVAAEPGSGGTPTLVATQSVAVGPGTTQVTPTSTTVTTTPAPTLTTGTLPTAPGETGTAPATAAPPATTSPPPTLSGGLVGWPAGRSGYTDVLASIPVSAGRAAAEAQARSAARDGLPEVGVLTSAQWSSLRAGYYVVFSGIYASPNAATSALAGAHAGGYAGAYGARVSP